MTNEILQLSKFKNVKCLETLSFAIVFRTYVRHFLDSVGCDFIDNLLWQHNGKKVAEEFVTLKMISKRKTKLQLLK